MSRASTAFTIALVSAVLSGEAATAAPEPPTGSSTGAWIRQKAGDTSKGTPIEEGRTVFQNRCSACHGAPGATERNGRSDMGGTDSLTLKYKGAKPGRLEERTDLTPDLVKYYVRNGVGYMPHFRKTYVSDDELNALAAYLTRPR